MPWPSHLLHAVPDAIDMDEAALLETLGIALHAFDLGEVPDGARVGVYGCGPIGLLLVQLLRRSGASVVVATDRLAHRVAAACAMGATDGFVVPDDQASAPSSPPDEAGRHRPVDVAFEVAGDDDALADAIAAVRPGGRVVLVGIPDGDRTTFRAAAARRKELTLQLSRRMLPTDLTRAIELVASGEIDLSALITHRFPIAEAARRSPSPPASGLKVVVNPSPIAGTARLMVATRYTIGVDFGTESARAVLVDVADGRELGVEVHAYRNGVIDVSLPAPDDDVLLGPDWALQDPEDYLETFRTAVRAWSTGAGIDPAQVIGIGIDFTACTMLPTTADGTPLCLLDAVPARPPRLGQALEAPRRAARGRRHQPGRRRTRPTVARALRRQDLVRVVLPEGAPDPARGARRPTARPTGSSRPPTGSSGS